MAPFQQPTGEEGCRKTDSMFFCILCCAFLCIRSFVGEERIATAFTPTILRIIAIANEQKLSPDEFVKLMLEHEARFFSVVLAMLPGCADAEDVVQNAITVMWQKFEQFERGTDFGAWGCSIVRFKVMEYMRKRRGNELVLSHEALEMVALDLENAADDLAARSAALKDCLAKLGTVEREMITIRFHPKMTLKKTAEQLGKSESTIRKWVRRTLRQLEACVNRTLEIDGELVHE